LASGTHFAFSARCKSGLRFCGEPAASGYAVVRDPALGEAQGHVCFYSAGAPQHAGFSIVVERGSGFYGSFPNFEFFAHDTGGEPPTARPTS
jgi:hypothetical protein